MARSAEPRPRLTLVLMAHSRKENEHRLPIHPEHLQRIDADLRAKMLVEEGYGLPFGMSDDTLAGLVTGVGFNYRQAPGVQFARQWVRVNALCPGPVDTPLLQHLFASDPEAAARRLVHVPMGRFGTADEMASAVAFLASPGARHITGRPRARRKRRRKLMSSSQLWPKPA